jgi:hypothetical protein
LNHRRVSIDQAAGERKRNIRKRIMLDTQFIETRMFREVPGGYIFQLPPPSIFTPTEAVLVTAGQKAEILALTRKGAPMARRLGFWGAVAIGIVIGRAAAGIPDMPTFGCVFLGFCAGFVALILATQFVMWRKLKMLRPLLQSLPRSAELLFPVGARQSWTDFRWLHRRGTAQSR